MVFNLCKAKSLYVILERINIAVIWINTKAGNHLVPNPLSEYAKHFVTWWKLQHYIVQSWYASILPPLILPIRRNAINFRRYSVNWFIINCFNWYNLHVKRLFIFLTHIVCEHKNHKIDKNKIFILYIYKY